MARIIRHLLTVGSFERDFLYALIFLYFFSCNSMLISFAWSKSQSTKKITCSVFSDVQNHLFPIVLCSKDFCIPYFALLLITRSVILTSSLFSHSPIFLFSKCSHFPFIHFIKIKGLLYSK